MTVDRSADDAMTESETLFERFCSERHIAIRRLEGCSTKTPDYEIPIGRHLVSVRDPPALPGRHPEFDSSGIEMRNSPS